MRREKESKKKFISLTPDTLMLYGSALYTTAKLLTSCFRLCPHLTEYAAMSADRSGRCQLTTAWHAQVGWKVTSTARGGDGGEAKSEKKNRRKCYRLKTQDISAELNLSHKINQIETSSDEKGKISRVLHLLFVSDLKYTMTRIHFTFFPMEQKQP